MKVCSGLICKGLVCKVWCEWTDSAYLNTGLFAELIAPGVTEIVVRMGSVKSGDQIEESLAADCVAQVSALSITIARASAANESCNQCLIRGVHSCHQYL